MSFAETDPNSVIGSWRRFGPFGVVYEVIGPRSQGSDGKTRVRIRVLHTEEELDYPLNEILEDPEED